VNHNAGNSYYQGLTISVVRRLTAGLQLQVSHTYSKNLDQSSSAGNNNGGYVQGQRANLFWDMDHRLGLSAQDIRNQFVTNATYELPNTGMAGIGGAVLNGWQVNGILSMSSGPAFQALDVNRNQQTAMRNADGLRANLVPGGDTNPVIGTPSDGEERYFDASQFVPSVCHGGRLCQQGDPDYAVGRFGNLGKNTLIGPGAITLDFSLNKAFQLTEENMLQFRAEFFNMLNRVNYWIPDAQPYQLAGTTLRANPSAGTITSTRTSARQIQFGLRFTF
jgi:hypothetical protein